MGSVMFSQLSGLPRDPDITLDYIGAGELLSIAPQFVSNFGLNQRVRLHGAAPEQTKQRLLQKCGVFVQHSIRILRLAMRPSGRCSGSHGAWAGHHQHPGSGIPEAVEEGVTGRERTRGIRGAS